MDVCCECCVLSSRADHSSRWVLPTVVRRCVWSRNLVNEKALAHWGLSRQKQKASKGSIFCSYNADHCKDRSVKWETSGSIWFFPPTYQPQKRNNTAHSIYILRVCGYLSFIGEWVGQSYKIQRRMVDCIGHILRRNCLDTCYSRKNTRKCIRDAKTRTNT